MMMMNGMEWSGVVIMNRYGNYWNGERTVFCDQFCGWKDSSLGVMREEPCFRKINWEGKRME